MVCVDGAAGLLAALPIVYPASCTHKIRNAMRKADHDTWSARRHERHHTDRRLRRAPFRRWRGLPQSRRVPAHLDELLTCWRYPTLDVSRSSNDDSVKTSDKAHWRQDRTSMDRILFAVFTHGLKPGVPTLFSLTQTF